MRNLPFLGGSSEDPNLISKITSKTTWYLRYLLKQLFPITAYLDRLGHVCGSAEQIGAEHEREENYSQISRRGV